MCNTNLYELGTVVRVHHKFMNSEEDELVGVIKGSVFDEPSGKFKYLIKFEPTESEKKLGVTSSNGYVFQEEIIGVAEPENNSFEEELLKAMKDTSRSLKSLANLKRIEVLGNKIDEASFKNPIEEDFQQSTDLIPEVLSTINTKTEEFLMECLKLHGITKENINEYRKRITSEEISTTNGMVTTVKRYDYFLDKHYIFSIIESFRNEPEEYNVRLQYEYRYMEDYQN